MWFQFWKIGSGLEIAQGVVTFYRGAVLQSSALLFLGFHIYSVSRDATIYEAPLPPTAG